MKRILVPCFALVLSACAGLTSIEQLDRGGFTRDQYALAVSDGPALAIVRSNPFAEDADDAGLISAFSGRLNPPLLLSKTPPVTRRFDYRLVIQFGEAVHESGAAGGIVATCEDRARAQALPAEGPWPFRIAFCNGQRAVSQARGFMPRSASPNSPEFRRAVAMVMTALTDPNVSNLGTSNDAAILLR
jgi:hypothetical protein